jgi:homocysteine S-methyltransferase
VNFIDRLRSGILVADGAIGTMLYNKGVSLDANFEHLNLVRPELVRELHREYLDAGADLIETNTFGANRTRLQAIGLAGKVREINLRGAQLAREAAAGRNAFVAGSVGPLVRIRGEEAELAPADVSAIFREQTHALAEGGVDLLLLETFTDLNQLLAALAAARETGLPVVTSMAFQEGGRTAGGADAEAVVAALEQGGAAAIGANCGAGPLEVLQIIGRMARATGLPLVACPNSGFPEYVEGRYLYRTTPDYFARMAQEIVRAGANIVGGCCGTTPDHIRAIAGAVRGMQPSLRVVREPVDISPAPSMEVAAGSGFLSRWGRETVVTVEQDPPRGLDCSKVLHGSRMLMEAGADAINLAENPLARVRMGNIALASLIQREVGIEVIAHITCRDRNILGLQSDLMGASLLGIRHLLAVTGDPARIGEHAGATSVYDLNSFGLIELMNSMNTGVNSLGNPIGRSAGFTIGAAFNPNSPRMEVQVARLEKKVANGALFAQTQPIFDLALLREMLERTGHLPIPILPGVLPLVSERNCEYLHNEVPGISIPDAVRRRMAGKEKEEGAREGLAIAKEFIAAAHGMVGGFYLIPPFGRYEIATELIRFIRGLSPRKDTA